MDSPAEMYSVSADLSIELAVPSANGLRLSRSFRGRHYRRRTDQDDTSDKEGAEPILE